MTKILFKHCVRELDLEMSSATVLEIYQALSHYQNLLNVEEGDELVGVTQAEARNIIGSLTPVKTSSLSKKAKSKKMRMRPLITPEDFGAALLNNALEFIDMHAEFVLTDRKINDLPFQELYVVMKRDTLQVTTELVVYNCLASWSMAECIRRQCVPSPENRRQVLGPLCYAPRYLLMRRQEFETACLRVELLDPAEIALVSDALQGKKIKNLSREQTLLLQRFRTPRPKFARMPIHLSDRSNPKNYPRLMRRAEKGREGCLESFGLNCLSIFTCIFD